MGQAQLQADIGSIIVQATFWTSLLLPVVTALYWKWWHAPFGRVTMSIDFLLALAFLPAVLRRLLGIPMANPAYTWFTLAVIGLIPVRTVWLAVVIWRLQRQPPAAPVPPPGPAG